MRRRNPYWAWNCVRLRQWRIYETSEEVMPGDAEAGMFSPTEKKGTYNPKPYEQMTCPGQTGQVDVKVVPRSCISICPAGILSECVRSNNFPMSPLHWLSPQEFSVHFLKTLIAS